MTVTQWDYFNQNLIGNGALLPLSTDDYICREHLIPFDHYAQLLLSKLSTPSPPQSK